MNAIFHNNSTLVLDVRFIRIDRLWVYTHLTDQNLTEVSRQMLEKLVNLVLLFLGALL